MLFGCATIDITPERPLYLAGFGPDRLSTGVYHKLLATAVVFESEGARAGFIALDVLTVDDSLVEPLRAAAAREGIPPERFFLATSHSHTGPVIERVRSPIRKFDDQYLDELQARLEAVLSEAVADLAEARLEYGVGSCTMAVNRRVPFDSGCSPNPDRPIDPDVPVVTVAAPDGTMRAVLFSYACHPASNNDTLIGAEYPGFARDYIAAKVPGCLPVFLQGCGADAMPRSVEVATRAFTLASVEEMRCFGHQLGQAVCTTLCGQLTPVADGPVAGAREVLGLPFDHQPTEEELRAHETCGWLPAETWARRAREALAADGCLPGTLPIEIMALRLGDLYLITSAAETSLEIGLRIKAGLADLRPITLAYVNGSWDYVSPPSATLEDNYEGWRCHLDTTYPWPKPLGLVLDADDRLVEASVCLVRGLTV